MCKKLSHVFVSATVDGYHACMSVIDTKKIDKCIKFSVRATSFSPISMPFPIALLLSI